MSAAGAAAVRGQKRETQSAESRSNHPERMDMDDEHIELMECAREALLGAESTM